MPRLSGGEIRRAHAVIGCADVVLAQRRTLYAAVIELMTGDARPLSADVLDNPVTRGHVGAVLGGLADFAPNACAPLSDLVGPGYEAVIGGTTVRVASSPAAPGNLRGAMLVVERELERCGDSDARLTLLTAGDRAALRHAADVLTDGVRLAVAVEPELALDLVPHVGLFAVLRQSSTGRLGSASVREYPGLIMVPEPRTVLEAAEAVVHEGAHQKFFDLAVTSALLGAERRAAPRFQPSWAPPGSPGWGLEQTFAAFHAYCCLAAFSLALVVRDEVDLHAGSLLPVAHDRAAELGDFLLAQGEYLGRDGHVLLRELLGREPEQPSRDDPETDVRAVLGGDLALVKSCGRRALIVTTAHPPDLVWVSDQDANRLCTERALTAARR